MTTDTELRRAAYHGDPLARYTLNRRMASPMQLSRIGAKAAGELLEALGYDAARQWLDDVAFELGLPNLQREGEDS